ncbi:bacteriocin [Lactococcus lactis]|uniref:bacteriocin n=1 Tax=Lactococcus lactis TaxID=1358 RepID=UPI001E53AA3D|nr:bacteriocin [Lactococcus lactis]
MENRLIFEAISDDELAKIVGGGYPNNQSMNDVLQWLNGSMVIMMEIPNNYLNGWVV